MKPKIFIGSSVEGIEIARAIQENLDFDAFCNIWDQGIFELLKSSLENLINATNNFDYAIFVFQPDDVTKIRESEYLTVRDNLIFELGLFISKIGKDNVFFVIPRGVEKLHIPTDLLGIQPSHYEVPEDNKNLLASLGPFCNKVRRKIKEKVSAEETKIEIIDDKLIEIEELIIYDKQEDNGEEFKTVEYGVSVDKFGNYTISIAPTVFFSHRMAKAFPRVRDLKWFDDPVKALDRLEILLRNPLKFEKAIGYGVSDGPIWWSRGFSD